MIRDVIFYETDSGRRPVEEFLDTLSAKQALKAAWVIQLVEDMEIVPTEYLKKMSGTDDLWEIRVKAAGNIFRF